MRKFSVILLVFVLMVMAGACGKTEKSQNQQPVSESSVPEEDTEGRKAGNQDTPEDYNTVLDEAQRDQNEQARLEIKIHVENMVSMIPSFWVIQTGGHPCRCRLPLFLKNTTFQERRLFRSAVMAEGGSGRA